jgi:hypothetical protein
MDTLEFVIENGYFTYGSTNICVMNNVHVMEPRVFVSSTLVMLLREAPVFIINTGNVTKASMFVSSTVVMLWNHVCLAGIGL